MLLREDGIFSLQESIKIVKNTDEIAKKWLSKVEENGKSKCKRDGAESSQSVNSMLQNESVKKWAKNAPKG